MNRRSEPKRVHEGDEYGASNWLIGIAIISIKIIMLLALVWSGLAVYRSVSLKRVKFGVPIGHNDGVVFLTLCGRKSTEKYDSTRTT